MRSAVHAVLFALTALMARLLQITPRRSGPTRSLWAGVPVINIAVNAQAERRLGIEADSLVYETYFITDAFTYDLSRWMSWFPLRVITPYIVLLWSIRKYDRFHFYCDRGLLTPQMKRGIHERELKLLVSLGKELIFWTYGADIRTKERTQALGKYSCCTHCPDPGNLCICDEQAGSDNYACIQRYARAVFSMGDMLEYTPGSMNDLYFWPVDLEADNGRRYEPVFPTEDGTAPLRVVHAPNHRHFKGTDYLLKAVEQLKAEGVEIELVLVERMPNRSALDVYRTADVIFDQCLIGFHGYLAQEAMALGKPVMCFIRRPDRYLLAASECPIVNSPPECIGSELRALANDRGRLEELGRRGRRYIERYHTPAHFADRLAAAYGVLGTCDV
jgi:glycosyltransferase involved in cell wall biosynthesis